MNQPLMRAALGAVLLMASRAGAQPAPGGAQPYPLPDPPPPWMVVIPLQQQQQQYNPYPQPYPRPAPAPQVPKNAAVINIRVPSTANDIWVDGIKMPTRITTSRVFISPPLEPGYDYHYTVRASWPGPLGMITQERSVIVGANRRSTVDFTQPAP